METWYDQDEDEVLDRGLKFIETFWETGSNGPDIEPQMIGDKPGCEAAFEIELAGIKIIGFADLVEDGNVSDYKVAKTARFYDVERSLQLSIYALAFEKRRVGYYVFEKKTGKVVELFANRNLKATRKWVEFVVGSVAQGISRSVFPPCQQENAFLCSEAWCPHYGTCAGVGR